MKLTTTMGTGPVGAAEGDLVAINVPPMLDGQRIRISLALQSDNAAASTDDATVKFKFYFQDKSAVLINAANLKNATVAELDLLEFVLQRVGADLVLFDPTLENTAGKEASSSAVSSKYGAGKKNTATIAAPNFGADGVLRISALVAAAATSIDSAVTIVPKSCSATLD